jgi:MFS family permease
VASHNLGKLGAEEGKPVLVQWRWFDSKPTLPLWIGLLLLLVVPKENRKWQAWLILMVPLLAVALRLFYFMPGLGSSAGFDIMIQLVVTFAIGWAAVWLLAPYLSRGSRLRAFVSALAVMFVVGLVAYLSYFGFWCSSQAPAMTICFWIVGSVSLLLALTLSGACCRKRFHSGIIASWLMLWLPLLTAIGTVVGFAGMIIVEGGLGLAFIVQVVLMMLFGSLFVSGFLYAVNLPVMFLAGLTDCYRDRLRGMVFRESSGDNPFGQTSLAGENPFEV